MKKIIVVMAALLTLAACSSSPPPHGSGSPHTHHGGRFKVGNPYTILGRTYYPKDDLSYREVGVASWYGPGFHGKSTANGEVYNQRAMTAAHRTLAMPSVVRVTNLKNGRSIVVTVNDRGPFAHDRIIDMSEHGAELLGFKNAGTTRVRVEVLPRETLELRSRYPR